MKSQGMERTAILTETMEEARTVTELLPNETELVIDENQKTDPLRLPVMAVYFAKGLEYDGVIALDSMKDSLIHYVLCTRALHRLIHIKLL